MGFFLDGGNGSYRKTVPIDDAVLDHFIRHVICDKCRLCVYGTSYQWRDEQRPWIGIEQTYFTDFLKLMQRAKQIRTTFALQHHMYHDKILTDSLKRHTSLRMDKQPASRQGIFKHFELLRV